MTRLFKYVDDLTIIAPVWKEVDYCDQLVSQFLDWMNTNGISCNASKCKRVDNQKERQPQSLFTYWDDTKL